MYGRLMKFYYCVMEDNLVEHPDVGKLFLSSLYI